MNILQIFFSYENKCGKNNSSRRKRICQSHGCYAYGELFTMTGMGFCYENDRRWAGLELELEHEELHKSF